MAAAELPGLAAFLAERLGRPDAHDMVLERIAGGQSNPTYVVTLPGRKLVLRKQPAGPILPSAHAIDREYQVMTALAATDVPVPRTVLFHADPAPLGTPFYLMEHVPGRVFHDAALPGLAPAERRAIYLGMAETLARLHAIDPASVGLAQFGRPGSYFQRQLARWSRQWAQSPTAAIPELDALTAWLRDHLPGDDGRLAIAHGDFRIGNLMIHPHEPRIVAVLDWELATIGHPLADLGFCCMPWHTAPDEYRGILGLDHAALGIPAEAEFVARYIEAARDPGTLLPFHRIFALFRFAVIFVGIADRARAGSAAGDDAAALGHLAHDFARRALDLTAQA